MILIVLGIDGLLALKLIYLIYICIYIYLSMLLFREYWELNVLIYMLTNSLQGFKYFITSFLLIHFSILFLWSTLVKGGGGED